MGSAEIYLRAVHPGFFFFFGGGQRCRNRVAWVCAAKVRQTVSVLYFSGRTETEHQTTIAH